MTSLVTGGAGFIGSNIVRALLERGDDVIVVDDLSTGRLDRLPTTPRLTVIEDDVAGVADLDSIVARCEYVFHLAAQVGVTESTRDPVRDAHSNVMGTVALLNACRGSSVRRIVCSASAAAFGEAVYTPVDEHHPQEPASYYALSKLTAERYARLAATTDGLPTVCLRYFNVFGLPLTNSEYAGVISKFAGCLAREEPLIIYGDGLQDRDFVYVNDVVAANLLAAQRGYPGKVYNIGTGSSTTVLELANLMCELAGVDPGIEFRPQRAGEIRHSVAAIGLARADLGYEPKHDLRSGLQAIWSQLGIRALGEAGPG